LKFLDIPANACAGKSVQDIAGFTSDGVPVIVRIASDSRSFSHFVVVDGVTIRQGVPVVAIGDPHGVHCSSSVDTFGRSFTGEVAVPRRLSEAGLVNLESSIS
jgi:filamentous hemagglutinin